MNRFRDPQEFKNVFEHVFVLMNEHPEVGRPLRDAHAAHRFVFPDLGLEMNVTAAPDSEERAGRYLRWVWGPADWPPSITLTMNNGVANEAIRCFRRILNAFVARVRAANPRLTVHLEHVQPRNLGELPSHQVDLFISSGGPGSPHDGWEQRWCTGYRHFLDWMMDAAVHRPDAPPAGFLVCHSYELAVQHFGFARIRHRGDLKFAIFPAYLTDEGRQTPFLAPFDDRLFIWEHRHWQAVEMDRHMVSRVRAWLAGTPARNCK